MIHSTTQGQGGQCALALSAWRVKGRSKEPNQWDSGSVFKTWDGSYWGRHLTLIFDLHELVDIHAYTATSTDERAQNYITYAQEEGKQYLWSSGQSPTAVSLIIISALVLQGGPKKLAPSCLKRLVPFESITSALWCGLACIILPLSRGGK